MMKIKVVIFDCDGVLFDTTKANTAYYNHILLHFDKHPMTAEQFDYCHMHTADESLAYLFDSKNALEAAKIYRKQMSYEPFIKAMEMEPHLIPLLEYLRPAYKTAIATNRSDTMDRVLSEFDLERHFDLIVTALDVERPKPHPDPLIRVLKYFKVQPHETVYVGDSEVDEIAAKAAGIPLIAYKNTSLSADFHVTSLAEIKTILLRC